MKPSFSSKAGQLLTVILLLMPLSVAAKQKSVYGEFTENPDGCINDEVFVHARAPGRSENARVTINIYREDLCRDQPLLMLNVKNVPLKKGRFVLGEDLSGASLKGVIPIVNKSRKERYLVRLNMSWKAVDELMLSDKKRDVTELASDEAGDEREDEIHQSDRFKAGYRDAVAHGMIEVNGEILTLDKSRGAYLVSTQVQEHNYDED
jgi:hypothetical protein